MRRCLCFGRCADGDTEAIARAARRCFASAPPKQLRSWATHLLCCRVAQNDGPFGLLAKLAETNQRACGHVFAAGDIAWNCRTCQKDNTCVLCDACFRSRRTTRATRSSSTGPRRAGVAIAAIRRRGSPIPCSRSTEHLRSSRRILYHHYHLVCGRPAKSSCGKRLGTSSRAPAVRAAARPRTLQLEPGLLDDGTERGDGVVR